MARSWTFWKKIAAGFALSFVLLAVVGAIAYRSINALSQTSYSVAHTHLVLEHVASVLSLLKDAETGQRGYIITGDESFLGPYQAAGPDIETTVKDLRDLTSDNPAQQKRIGQVEPLIAAKLFELKRVIEMRRNRDVEQATKAIQAGEGKRLMDELRGMLGEMEREERDLLKQRAGEVRAAATDATVAITIGTLLGLLLVTAAGFTITRSLTSQIGAAVQHMQSSSGELQAAANQQATGAKEQSTAMNEITTTMSELRATSKQIADSAQRVAQIAEETGKGARSGEQTVSKARSEERRVGK